MYCFTSIYYVDYWKCLGDSFGDRNIFKLHDHKALEDHKGNFTAWKQILQDFIK